MEALERTYKSLPRSNPQIVANTNPARPKAIIFNVFNDKKFVPIAVAPTEIPKNNVTIFIKAFDAVSERRAVTPVSLKRFPNIKHPRSGATEGNTKQVNSVTIIGNSIFSLLVTGLVGFIITILSFGVVKAFIRGG